MVQSELNWRWSRNHSLIIMQCLGPDLSSSAAMFCICYDYVSFSKCPKQNKIQNLFIPGAPLTYFSDWGVWVILAQSDFLGSVKKAEIFLGREKNTDFFGLRKKD